jgi:ferritin
MIPETKIVNGPGAVINDKETELKLTEERVCIQPKTLDLLQEQIKHELFAERLYLSISAWCDKEGLTETAKFYSDHSQEERKLAMRFVNFIQKRGEHAKFPDTEQPVQDFEDIREAIDASLDHEYFITDRIKNIYKEACAENELLAQVHAHEFLVEQVEEEQLFLSLSKWLTVCDNNLADFELEVMKIHKKEAHLIGEI